MDDEIVYRLMTQDDVDAVKELLYASFFADEPLGNSLKIQVPHECKVYVDTLTEFAVGCKEIVSIVAEICKNDGSKLVVGCRLSVVETPTSEFKVELSEDDPNHRKIGLIITYLGFLHKGVDVFERYDVDQCVHFQALNVRKEYGGRGIGKRLIEESINVGKAKGIRLFMAEASGKFSQRIYEKLKFDVVNEVMYDNYLDKNGERVFGDTGVHVSGKLVAKLYEIDDTDINENAT